MIGIETYLITILVLIIMYAGGLYAVYHDNVLGFVASGFASIVTIVMTVLGAFGRVGNEISHVLYSYVDDVGTSVIDTSITLIDSAYVLITAFISVMMCIVLIFIIGRYIASVVASKGDEEE